jgi:hypothetical protein
MNVDRFGIGTSNERTSAPVTACGPAPEVGGGF